MSPSDLEGGEGGGEGEGERDGMGEAVAFKLVKKIKTIKKNKNQNACTYMVNEGMFSAQLFLAD